MKCDQALLKSYAEMETWDQFLERNGALGEYVSREVWKHAERKYFREVERRIEYCKELLGENDNWYARYVLAELYDRVNLDDFTEHLYKRSVRYWCIKAIRKKPDYAPAWALLAEAYAWVAMLGGESETMPTLDVMVEENVTVDIGQGNPAAQKKILWLAERAIRCSKEALNLDPENRRYHKLSKECYGLKADILEIDEKL